MTQAIIVILGFAWLGMFLATYLAYLATTVKLFGNRCKITLGLPYTVAAWPHVLYHVIKGEN